MNYEEMDELSAKIQRRIAERKAAERGYTVTGDIWWWSPEPPAFTWWASGLLCAVNASPMSGFNGYVQLPVGHPWLEPDFDVEGEVRAPGGITFGPHVARWIGFDTGHGWDYWPQSELDQARADGYVSDEYWTKWKIYREMGLFTESDTRDSHWTMSKLRAEIETLARAAVKP